MKAFLWKVFAIAIVAVLYAAPAQAQATRTWVSGVGDDVNPCSRTAPCKTFAGAISKTAAGGEIDCLDSGGFGTLTITKSLTIDCAGTLGSVLASGVNGIVISSGTPSVPVNVILRNLSINGAGTTLGVNGIRALLPGTLLLENVLIQNFSAQGLDAEPSQGNLNVSIKDSTVKQITSGGILLKPGASANVAASLTRVSMYDGQFGLRAEDRSKASVFQSIASGNNGNGFLAVSAAAAAEINLVNSVASNTATNGVATSGALATIRMLNSAAVNNATGISNPSGTVAGTTPDTNITAGNTASDGAVNANVTLQ